MSVRSSKALAAACRRAFVHGKFKASFGRKRPRVVFADTAPLLAVEALTKTFRPRRTLVTVAGPELHAVRDVSFDVSHGSVLGIVGESGSGKTTLARMITALERPTSGTVLLDGRKLQNKMSASERRARAKIIQLVFQDPYTSLNPRQSVRRALLEVQSLHFQRSRAQREARAHELLDAVGLGQREANAFPRELSGGQRQRAAIARALVAEPRLVVLDEPVSALDVSIQAQIINLLAELRAALNLTYLFISHDLAVISQIADEVLVMYRGRVAESGPSDAIFHSPRHPYTQRLLESAPKPGVEFTRRAVGLEVAHSGCLFKHRCPHVFDRCASEPGLYHVGERHYARCWLVDPAPSPDHVLAAVPRVVGDAGISG